MRMRLLQRARMGEDIGGAKPMVVEALDGLALRTCDIRTDRPADHGRAPARYRPLADTPDGDILQR